MRPETYRYCIISEDRQPFSSCENMALYRLVAALGTTVERTPLERSGLWLYRVAGRVAPQEWQPSPLYPLPGFWIRGLCGRWPRWEVVP